MYHDKILQICCEAEVKLIPPNLLGFKPLTAILNNVQ